MSPLLDPALQVLPGEPKFMPGRHRVLFWISAVGFLGGLVAVFALPSLGALVGMSGPDALRLAIRCGVVLTTVGVLAWLPFQHFDACARLAYREQNA